MNTLNEVTAAFLKENGILGTFFARYIGCEYSYCAKWLKGQRKLKPAQLEKVHEFLSGEFLKPVDEIVKGE